MMRKHKTSATKRETYKYLRFDENGNADDFELAVNEQLGITPEWIAILHQMDDEEVDAERRYIDNLPPYVQQPEKDGSYISDSKNPIWRDMSTDPEQILFGEGQAVGQYDDLLPDLREAMEHLQPQQQELFVRFYVDRLSATDIAKEDGVTEGAIRYRLSKIHTRLKKLMEP